MTKVFHLVRWRIIINTPKPILHVDEHSIFEGDEKEIDNIVDDYILKLKKGHAMYGRPDSIIEFEVYNLISPRMTTRPGMKPTRGDIL